MGTASCAAAFGRGSAEDCAMRDWKSECSTTSSARLAARSDAAGQVEGPAARQRIVLAS